MVKGYKAFDKNLECRSHKFKVGKSYEIDGKLSICNNGYHFCINLLDVYNYYEKSETTRICEVEALGDVETEGDKSVTSKIKIVRELDSKEILGAVFKNNNSGNRNSGYGNSGNRNSGYGNSGNRNSGDWNSGDGNSGYFNTKIPVYFFNKPSSVEYTKEFESKIRGLNVKPILTWVPLSMMTEIEKKDNPSSKTTEGFLRKTDRHDWRSLTDLDKEFIKTLPNFNNEIFMKISNGVSLLKPQIKVIVNGIEKYLDEEKAKELGLL
jgi:hypothetical protein